MIQCLEYINFRLKSLYSDRYIALNNNQLKRLKREEIL